MPTLPPHLVEHLRDGTAIPAMPLAQDESGAFDPAYQKALVRYYVDAGTGGLAVGVHSTQFNIRDPEVNLYEAVLAMASDAIDEWINPDRPYLKIAGIVGRTDQALNEARVASKHGYHAGLLSLSAFKDASVSDMIDHARAIANVLPLMGFYLQPAVGGRILPESFWKEFAAIENVVAVKISPFNRYQTLDVIRGIALSGRADEIALYTGNDDNIVADLLTPFKIQTPDGMRTLRITGGLLGHWAVWTQASVRLFSEIKSHLQTGSSSTSDLLAKGVHVTEMNGILFDVTNNFHGCLPGIHEVLRRQGLRRTNRCIDPDETLSPGQSAALERISQQYPDLVDDEFVAANLERWLS